MKAQAATDLCSIVGGALATCIASMSSNPILSGSL